MRGLQNRDIFWDALCNRYEFTVYIHNDSRIPYCGRNSAQILKKQQLTSNIDLSCSSIMTCSVSLALLTGLTLLL